MVEKFKYHSQSKQDFIVNKLLRNKKNGFFVDIGAHDGLNFSNTYFFEKELNWKGLCIEPVPNFFNKLVKCRNSICLNICVANTENRYSFVEVEGPASMLSGIIFSMQDEHFLRIKTAIDNFGGSYKVYEIKARLISNILDEYKIKNIDYLSLDVEGLELEILKSIKFNEINISILTVENDKRSKFIENFLRENGFISLCFTGPDEIFVNKNHIKFNFVYLFYYIKGYIQRKFLI